MFTPEETNIIIKLLFKEIAAQREAGESDWSEYTTQLFSIYRKV
jgi:hypothetical protein